MNIKNCISNTSKVKNKVKILHKYSTVTLFVTYLENYVKIVR